MFCVALSVSGNEIPVSFHTETNVMPEQELIEQCMHIQECLGGLYANQSYGMLDALASEVIKLHELSFRSTHQFIDEDKAYLLKWFEQIGTQLEQLEQERCLKLLFAKAWEKFK